MYRNRQASQDRRAERDALKKEAAERTAEAEKSIADLERVLVSVVEASPVFEIAKQKIVSPFNEPQPQAPKYFNYPREPKREDWTFVPEFGFVDKLIAFRRNTKRRLGEEKAEIEFVKDHAQWSAECKRIQKANEELHKGYQELLQKWATQKASWEDYRNHRNTELDITTAGLRNGDADSVCWLFQNAWNYLLSLPEDLLSGEYQLHFDEDAKTLVIDLDLPEFERTPNVKAIRYVASRNEIEEVLHKDSFVRESMTNLFISWHLPLLMRSLLAIANAPFKQSFLTVGLHTQIVRLETRQPHA